MQDLFREAAVARRTGRYRDAEASYRRWIALEPNNPAPQYGLATLLLARGAYAEGWRLYEARAAVQGTGVRKPTFSFPEWRGEPIRSLLICPEQGLGDQIMFARYIAPLRDRGIAVTLVCPPPLVRLFAQFGVTILSAEGEVPIPRHDAWALIGSLPYLVGPIAAEGYLPSASAGAGIGVMAAGNPAHVNDRSRSLPPELRPQLFEIGRSLDPEATGARDFQDTADVIAGLELVISVDTAVAHLAGAMAKPCWLLLAADADWRWGYSGERSPWYPSTRLFRQQTAGDWSSVLAAVADAISRSEITAPSHAQAR